MCVESMSSGGKATTVSDRSIAALEQAISNLQASEAVLQAQVKRLTDEKARAEAARDWAMAQGRDLQSQLDKWREARGQQPHST